MRKQGKALTPEEKWMVLNVFQNCEKERKLSKTVKTVDAYKRVSCYTGVSRKIVVQIASYFKKNGTVPPTILSGNQTNHSNIIDPSITERVRCFIFDRHRGGEACNAKHIQDILNDEFKLKVHIRTVRRYLNRWGFQYARTRKKTRSLREKPYVRQQRHSYLHAVRDYRIRCYTIAYLDESFLHHYHGKQFSWFDDSDFIERPSGKGRRWCFINAVCNNGLIPNCSLIFEGRKSTGDYHGSFNFDVFYKWFTESLLPNLSGKTCIVLDRATYHMVPEERIIPGQMRKGDIQEWLSGHNILWEEHWLKPKLVQLMEANIDRTPLVSQEAQKHGHEVLFLPVHHPELNPIELVWAIIKNDCAKKLRTGVSFAEVRKHLEYALAELSEETCKKLNEHVKKKEHEYWDMDIELENFDDDEVIEFTEIEEDDYNIEK